MMTAEENFSLQRRRFVEAMVRNGVDAALVTSLVNLYYFTGEVFSGYLYITSSGDFYRFLKRDSVDKKDYDFTIRKPEQIPDILKEEGLEEASVLMLEFGEMSHSDYVRLEKVFSADKIVDSTPLLRSLRSIKSPWEIEQIKKSAFMQAEICSLVPEIYKKGMTDIELQSEIEMAMRKRGSIGCFRAFGSFMEIHMGSLLAGDNAAAPSPYDFALGGRGVHPAMPLGACGMKLEEGMAVMVDMAGNYTAYMSDMTRTFSVGKLTEKAYKAHSVSVEIGLAMMDSAKPGTPCSDIYKNALSIVEKEGLTDCFMGKNLQAGFVGHGVGLQINELPVLAPRSSEVLMEGMTFAFEPKFVIDGVGAVGVENTFVVTEENVEKITVYPEGIITL